MYGHNAYFKKNGEFEFSAQDLKAMPQSNLLMVRQSLMDRQFELVAVADTDTKYKVESDKVEAGLQLVKDECKNRGLPC